MRIIPPLASFLGLLLCIGESSVLSFHITPAFLSHFPRQTTSRLQQSSRDNNDNDGIENQALEAIQSLADFHEGQWRGQGAKSFTVSADTAAGVLQRTTSDPYQVSVKLGMDLANRDFTLTETISWGDDKNDRVSSRTTSLQTSNTDVDTVDASFSLDTTLPNLPAALIGTELLPKFLIEHVVAVSEDERARCLVLYGMDKSLMRIVVCHETRVLPESVSSKPEAPNRGNTWTAADLLEMQSDVDRLVNKIAGEDKSITSSTDKEISDELDRIRALEDVGKSSSSSSSSSGKPLQQPTLIPHAATLLELTSGVWLGDLIMRDKPSVPLTPSIRGQGFGSSSSSSSSARAKQLDQAPARAYQEGFAKWSIGVQKAAWRWMWGFEEEIRQVTDFGKGLGAEYAGSMDSLPGQVCVNEGLSRRMLKEDRMVYIDWGSSNGGAVSFLCDFFSVLVPRYLTFSDEESNNGSNARPFYTEFGVYQKQSGGGAASQALGAPSLSAQEEFDRDDSDFDVDGLPEVVCSKIARVYNFEGLLKQGCTSFYTLKRFGGSDDT